MAFSEHTIAAELPEVTFTATGDSFIVARRRVRDTSTDAVTALIQQADVRFSNLEVVVREEEDGFPAAQSGGTWASAPVAVLEELAQYGFNMLSWATNHTMDYSYGGLLATRTALNRFGFVHAGAGRNLAEASAPSYLELGKARIALISATSTFHESWVAGEQRPDMLGRPGVNPLRHVTIYRLSADKLGKLQSIARESGINEAHELSVAEGFARKDGEGIVRFGQHLFRAVQEGESEGASTIPLAEDVERIRRSIRNAKRQADYVLVSLHAHEMATGGRKEIVSDFVRSAARDFIDSGAHAILGHGPHIVRGIEIYRQRPIFYSLGNFIFQNEAVTALPADFYQKYGLKTEHTLADALDCRSQNGRIGLGRNHRVWESVVPLWKMKNGELEQLSLHAIDLGQSEPRYRRGFPRLTKNLSVLKDIQRLSSDYGTSLRIDEAAAVAHWNR